MTVKCEINTEAPLAHVKEFFSISSTHGIGYFFSELSSWKRWFWIVVTICMISLGGILVSNLR